MNPTERSPHPLPSEWKLQTVGSLASPARNAIVGGPFGSELVSKDYVATGGVPVIRGQNMGPLVVVGPYAFVTEEKADSLKANLAKPGDMVFTQRGTLGQVSIVPLHPYHRYLISQSQMKVAVDPTLADSTYVHSWFTSDMGQSSIAQSAIQTGVPHINLGILRSLSLPVPPLSEQRNIARALSDVSAVLLKLGALIAKKRDLRQAAVQQLLTGKGRLPGCSAPLEEKRLGQIGRCMRGVSYKAGTDLSPYDMSHTRRLLRSNNVQDSTVVTDDVQFVNVRCVSDDQVLRPNDVLICMANGSKALVGKAGLFDVNDGHVYTFGAFMGCFRVHGAYPEFVGYLFRTDRYRKYISNLLAGSSINNLRPSNIESLEFAFPSTGEQIAIAAVLSDMDAEIAALEARRDKTRALKQGMMQQLLTGRIRLI